MYCGCGSVDRVMTLPEVIETCLLETKIGLYKSVRAGNWIRTERTVDAVMYEVDE